MGRKLSAAPVRRSVRSLVALTLASTAIAIAPAWAAVATRAAASVRLEVRESPAVVVTRDVRFGTDHAQALLLDVYQPSGANRPAVILIHGGGFRGGDKGDNATAANTFADAGYVVFVPNYLLAPAYPYPAAVNDVEQAAAWVKTHAAAYGADAKRVASFGISTGGNLAAMLAVKRDVNVGASWSGPLDLLAMGGPVAYAPTRQDKIGPAEAPYGNAGDPPLLVANSVA